MRIYHLLTHTKANYKGHSWGRRKVSTDKRSVIQEGMITKENSNLDK